MARYYEIAVTATSGTTSPLAQIWSSLYNGQNDPGALNVQLDLVSTIMGVPGGNCTITIEGVPLALLQQSANFSGLNITVKGGMFAPPGNQLQLIVPKQAGLLLQGQIFQSFGNWQGTDQNLNFVVVPSGYTFDRPGNFVFIWMQGQSLALALANTLGVAYPNTTVINQIGGSYVCPYTPQGQIAGRYRTLSDLSQFIYQLTKSTNGPGVHIAMQSNGAILLFDGLATPPGAVQINFTDLIGQPKWVDPETLQFTAVMRADIQVGTYVVMPVGMQSVPGIVLTQASALPGPLKYKTAFQGQFLVTAVRHIGNFRDPDGTSWASIFQAIPASQAQIG